MGFPKGRGSSSRALRRIKGGFSKGAIKRSSGPISRIPGGDRVAVKVGVVQMEEVNDISMSFPLHNTL